MLSWKGDEATTQNKFLLKNVFEKSQGVSKPESFFRKQHPTRKPDNRVKYKDELRSNKARWMYEYP